MYIKIMVRTIGEGWNSLYFSMGNYIRQEFVYNFRKGYKQIV